ncbi:MAG: HEAT repeat domain-containing protein, partial [Bryobacterales bacterium]|nr:HEAT repeat domain-containing protein [Bryobacterales bacterium]
VVSDHAEPLSIFTWDKSRRAYYLNSGTNPSFTRDELIAALLELQADGDIRFLWGRPRDNWWRMGRPVRAVNAEEMEAGILNGVRLSYELTPQGGERWARICAVDWSRWLDGWICLPESPNADTLTTGDPEWTAFWFEVTARWKEVIPESVRWDEVRPWRPVYWHQEPVGYRVSYRLAGNGEDRANMPAAPWRRTPSAAGPLAPRCVRQLPAAAPTGRSHARKGPRREFAAVMEQARRQEHLHELRCWLRWRDAPHRYAAARELGLRRDVGSVDTLLEAVFSEHDLAAAEALAQIGDERCLAPLTTLFTYLSEHSGHLADTIGRTIASFGEAGVTALLPLLDRNGGAGLQALRHTRSERAIDAVRSRLGNSWQAISVLSSMGVLSRWPRPKRRITPEWLAALEKQAASPDWMSRYEVVRSLRDWRVDPAGAEPLLARLREDPDIVVRGSARLI